jgi:hypothetical protein
MRWQKSNDCERGRMMNEVEKFALWFTFGWAVVYPVLKGLLRLLTR